MKHADVVDYFGSEAEAARKLGWHRQKINRWKKAIPIDEQINIEVFTGGALKADLPSQVRRNGKRVA